MRGFFITGTGTGIGKTAVAAGLAWALRKRGLDVGVMKPFATADKEYSKEYRSRDTSLLAKAAGVNDGDSEINPFFYPLAASPLMASQILRKPPVNIQKALEALDNLASKHDFVVVEGIGGVMVPLTEKEYVLDFAKQTGLAILIVSQPMLGTLNHTLLTVMACRQFGLDISGIIINKMSKKPSIIEQRTPKVIERQSGIPVIGILPYMKGTNYRKMGKVLEKKVNLDKLLPMQQF